jgi:hypothetical protein
MPLKWAPKYEIAILSKTYLRSLTNDLTRFKEVITVILLNILCGQKPDFFNVVANGKYNKHGDKEVE